LYDADSIDDISEKMFDFEKLHVYQKAKDFNLKIKTEILSIALIDGAAKNQLRRASLSIMLNIAEGNFDSAMLIKEISM